MIEVVDLEESKKVKNLIHLILKSRRDLLYKVTIIDKKHDDELFQAFMIKIY